MHSSIEQNYRVNHSTIESFFNSLTIAQWALIRTTCLRAIQSMDAVHLHAVHRSNAPVTHRRIGPTYKKRMVFCLSVGQIRWTKCKFRFCRSVHARSRGLIKRTNNAPGAIVYKTVERAQTHEKRTCTACPQDKTHEEQMSDAWNVHRTWLQFITTERHQIRGARSYDLFICPCRCQLQAVTYSLNISSMSCAYTVDVL